MSFQTRRYRNRNFWYDIGQERSGHRTIDDDIIIQNGRSYPVELLRYRPLGASPSTTDEMSRLVTDWSFAGWSFWIYQNVSTLEAKHMWEVP